MENTESQILLPPRFVFEDDGLYAGSNNAHPEADPKKVPISIGVEWPADGGLLMHFENRKYPKQGWPFKAALLSIDAVKRAGYNAVLFIVSKPFRYALPLFAILPGFLKKKIIVSAMKEFSEYADYIFHINGAYWKSQYLCTMAREVARVGMELAHEDYEIKFVKVFCHILEFDDVWRYIWQDIMCQMDIPAFKNNPGKESKRLFKLAASRSSGIAPKMERMAFIIPFLFRISCFRNVVLDFFSRVDMEKLYLNENDWYQCLTCSAYDFGGKSIQARNALCATIDEKWMSEGGKHYKADGEEIIIPKYE